ncbi:MAG: carbohydrate ABC transporter permease [Chloroflexi bacterium]|nr:carbohydrate ABC transporter permease [Chloroflexota bacterium]MCY3582395.1 carbohydrate ABC transporter permease [Chloroflexota bacterium]MCY3717105.1 carbohydrate ABC transporter permease [Chloroflexota bacterium]MDE2650810.1 carbohydrate ABC transporter permease [Chloroflexota bacterium]MXX51753.1 carbohydrate ABC transporter permease [Chloroflexota bacterium]
MSVAQGTEIRRTRFGQKELLRLHDLLVYIVLSLVGIIFLLPFAWMVANSLKTIKEIYRLPPTFIPDSLQFTNYIDAWTATTFDRFFLNSVIVSACIVLGQLFTASLAGYSFARLRYPGRDKIFLLYISLLMVPFTVLMIPLYVQMRHFGWVNSLNAVIVPFLFTPWGTFLMRQFMVTIPRELEDAARIDGCGFFRTYALIILPLTKPALATLALFTFLSSWNSFQWPLIVLGTPAVKTLPLGLYSFQAQSSMRTPWHLIMAAATFVVLPILVAFVVGQKYYVRGIVTSGIKGGG